MKITPKEIGELFREFASINRETLKQARDTIEEQRKEIQPLKADKGRRKSTKKSLFIWEVLIMANHTTGSQRYNKRMDKIFEQAKISTNNWGAGMGDKNNDILNEAKLEGHIMSAHTPTPWNTHKTDTYTILETEQEEIGIIDLEENAQYIIKAVNMHDELVSTLEQLYPYCEGDTTRGIIEKVLSKAKGA